MNLLKTYKKAVKNQSIIPVENQVQKQSDLTKTFGKTNFDVENPAPLGGPEPKPYEISKANSPLLSTFGKTSLDLENPTPVGGPNRTTYCASKFAIDQVTTDQGPLLYNKNNLQGQSTGQIVNKELNQYTDGTYLEKITPYKNNNN